MNIRAIINYEDYRLTELINISKRESADAGIELVYYPSIGLSPSDIPPEVITILLEVAKSVTYSGIYDAIKYFVVSFKAKWENTFRTKVKKLNFVCNEEKYEIETNVELSQENVDKIIDSIARRIAKN